MHRIGFMNCFLSCFVSFVIRMYSQSSQSSSSPDSQVSDTDSQTGDEHYLVLDEYGDSVMTEDDDEATNDDESDNNDDASDVDDGIDGSDAEAVDDGDVENVFDCLTLPALLPRSTREVFLITYPQCAAHYTKESLSDIVIGALQNGVARVEKWVCAKEAHRLGGHHFHITVKLDRQKRWANVKRDVERDHPDIRLHFSAKQKEAGEESLYDGAYWYTVKGLDFITSPDHPIVCRKKDDKEEKLKNIDFLKLVVQMDLKTMLQVKAVCKRNADANQEALKSFLANRGEARTSELINLAWDIEEAPSKLKRLETNRIQMLRDAAATHCTCPSPALWHGLALQVLRRNNIPVDTYTQALLASLTLGRGKFRNIMLIGNTNCAKTFMLKPLTDIYMAFENPSRSSFNWVGVDAKEVILLNDFRWGSDVIPWEQFLLLLEGDTVHFPVPKSFFKADIALKIDTPIFATSRTEITYKGGEESLQENAMMQSRWKVFKFTYQFSEQEQVKCPPCKQCFAHFIFCANIADDL